MDPEYAYWLKGVIRNPEVKEWLKENLPSIGLLTLRRGKYAGMTYNRMVEHDPDYARFLVTIEKNEDVKAYLANKINELNDIVFPA